MNEKVELTINVNQYVEVDLNEIELQSVDNMEIINRRVENGDTTSIVYQIVFMKEGEYKLFINHMNKSVKQINL